MPEAENDILSSEAKDWQWWKLEFINSDSKPVVTTKVSEEDVLKAAQSESRKVLVVYASEAAMSYGESGLPSQMANFVRADNLNFDRELEEASVQCVQYASPGKRKAISDTSDDLITEHPRSPPFNRDHFSDDSLDPNPPGFDNNSPSPPSMPSFRKIRPKPEGSSDDTIPISLRNEAPTMDPTYMALDQDDMGECGQEMQERGGSNSLLQGRSGMRVDYHPGDYVPEITMEDEESEGQKDATSPYFANAQGRGNRADTH